MERVYRIGTRASTLARRQAEAVRARLADLRPGWRFRVVTVRSAGDRARRRPLAEFARPGVFTGALEAALSAGGIDLAVHSLKDLPTVQPPGLAVEVVTPRGDPREALVSRRGASLAELPAGAAVGTGSPRRRAFLLALRGDLRVLPVRGNVETRLAKLDRGELDALVLALAGLERLGLAGRAGEVFRPDRLPPAAGQGAVALEYRAGDAELADLAAQAREADTARAVEVERGVLARLGGGCRAPVGVLAETLPGEGLRVTAAVASPDGRELARVSVAAPRGERTADTVERVAEGLQRRGAGRILADARDAAEGARRPGPPPEPPEAPAGR